MKCTVYINDKKWEVKIPSNPVMRKKICEFAAAQVKKHGPRNRVGEYYHPAEFLPWKKYYQYRLFVEVQKAQRKTQGEMKTNETKTLADQYIIAPTWRARYMVLATAYARGGRDGVEALARQLGVDPAEAIAAAEAWFAARRRSKRGQKPPYVPPPPEPPRKNLDKEAREVALEAAGAAWVDITDVLTTGSGKIKKGGGRTDDNVGYQTVHQ